MSVNSNTSSQFQKIIRQIIQDFAFNMKSLLFVGVFLGIQYMCSGDKCELIIQKDGHTLQDGQHVVGLTGEINQIYCKALCTGPGPTPALRWYKVPRKKPVSYYRNRVYQVRTTFDRVNILTIRNMLYSDVGTYKCMGWLRDQGIVNKTFELTYGCRGLEHLCDTSKCLSPDKICDGNNDCTDGTDEQSCSECVDGQFQCSNGDCISGESVCDRFRDCIDGFDELNCGCKPDFTCTHGGCVSHDKVCDGRHDCNFGEDEDNCTYCMEGEYHCGYKVCIPSEQVCNGILECPDESDELNCEIKVKVTNPVQEVYEGDTVRFNCEATVRMEHIQYEIHWSKQEGSMLEPIQTEGDAFVINEATLNDTGFYVCTGINSFSNDTDLAELTVNPRCPGEFECSNGTCISTEFVCNYFEDCPEGEDELNCEPCGTFEFDCGNGTCISSDFICDGKYDCENGSDEQNCCEDRFKCFDGSCVDAIKWCDGRPDCINEEDEKNCSESTSTCDESSEFSCGEVGYCIPLTWRCDGSADCIDGSDECGCFVHEYDCEDGMCINITRKCDGVPDCEFGDDEIGCPAACSSTQYHCDDGACIDIIKKCDGVPDCASEEDEAECGEVICLEGQLLCSDKSSCISSNQYCDQQRDCDDGSDESEERCGPVITINMGADADVEIGAKTATYGDYTSHDTDFNETYYYD